MTAGTSGAGSAPHTALSAREPAASPRHHIATTEERQAALLLAKQLRQVVIDTGVPRRRPAR
jgi:hypothetical protein